MTATEAKRPERTAPFAGGAIAKRWLRLVRRRPVLALVLAGLVLTVPGLTSLPPLDRDESRYAQATAQMLESGNFIEIRFQDEARNKKPVGIYWLQSLAVAALSEPSARQIWAYRVPSLIGALAAVLFAFWGGRRLFGDGVALLGACWLAACLLVAAEATIAKTDAVLLACVTAMQMAMARIYLDARASADPAAFQSPGGAALLFWVALGFGLLVKGPIAPLIAAATATALAVADRDVAWLRRLSPLPGLVIVAVIVLPWSAAIYQATDGAFFTEAFGVDLAPKLMGGAESHGAPPGVFTLAAPVLFWPAAFLLLPAAVWSWRQRHDPSVRVCLAWLIPVWLVFELTPTKLPHYVLPLLPPGMLLIAAFLRASTRMGQEGGPRLMLILSCGLFAVVGLAFAGLMAWLPSAYGEGWSLGSVATALTLAVVIAATCILALRDRMVVAAALSFTASAILNLGLLAMTPPQLSALQASPRIAAAVAANAPGRPAVVSGYSEPSLVFLLGTETRHALGAEAAQLILAAPDQIAIVEERQDRAFRAGLKDRQSDLRTLDTVSGINYSRGEEITLRLYVLSTIRP